MILLFLQAILRQLGQLSNEPLTTDESELECHQQLQKLYTSTKTAKVYLYYQSLYHLAADIDLISSERAFVWCGF